MATRIIGVQFSLSNPADVEKRSAVEITTDRTYVSGQPAAGGVFDPRMGVIENGKRCPTCRNTASGCPGHFGHLKLCTPVYYIHLLPYVMKVLKCVCVKCSKLLVDTESEYSKSLIASGNTSTKIIDTLLTHIVKDIRYCGQENKDGCGAVQPIIQKDKKAVARIIGTYKSKTNPEPVVETYSAEYILRLFQRISDKDIRAMGLSPDWSRPEWLICTVLPVPPLAVRPSVMEDNKRMEDDITHQLLTIVKRNMKLGEMITKGDKTTSTENLAAALQWDVATYINNEIAGIPKAAQRSGRPLKTLMSRISGKTGRFRGNLMGKRVDYSARSVITPDPNLDIDEVGVPEEIAINQSIPEIVTPYNRERLQTMVENGFYKWPGAKSVKLASDGRTISLKIKSADSGFKLHDGDTVNRHLLDGDPVLMNRQPSLHRMSMMCHRTRVLPYSTFRLNPSACKPYNADFDGDKLTL